MSDKATIDALGYWVSRLSARVESLTARVEDLESCNRPIDPPGCGGCNRYHHGACDPEPVPEWRRLVDLAAGRMDDWMLPTPLGTVLDIFSYLEMYPRRTDDIIQLARLVAVCEAQVGDGWKAEPERMSGWAADWSVWGLLDVLTAREHLRWRLLGDRAACWLRDITEDMPEPVPEWRRLVDKAEPQARGHQNPFGYVLLQLSDITTTQRYPHLGVAAESIARIVAVCEAQVGDGWQAEPRYVPHADDHDIRCLITVMGERDPWRALGNRAAAWLRDITEDAS